MIIIQEFGQGQRAAEDEGGEILVGELLGAPSGDDEDAELQAVSQVFMDAEAEEEGEDAAVAAVEQGRPG